MGPGITLGDSGRLGLFGLVREPGRGFLAIVAFVRSSQVPPVASAVHRSSVEASYRKTSTPRLSTMPEQRDRFADVRRLRSGWKNSGGALTWWITPERMVLLIGREVPRIPPTLDVI